MESCALVNMFCKMQIDAMMQNDAMPERNVSENTVCEATTAYRLTI